MKNWSNSTKVVVALVAVLVVFLVGRSITYRRMAKAISHQVATPAAKSAASRLILERKLARVFKDRTEHAKYQAIHVAQMFATNTQVVELEGHNITMAEAASQSLVEFLSDMDLEVRAEAALALGRMGKPAARPLLDIALNSPDKDVRNNATAALFALGHVAVPEMIAAVRSGKPTMKVGAANALGQLQATRAIDALIGALEPAKKEVIVTESDVRFTSRDALVNIGEPAVDPLIAALGKPGPFTRQHAAEALGEIGAPRAAEPMLALIEDGHRQVRLAGVYALGKLRQEVATEPLMAKLSDEDREMREGAAVSLGQIGDLRAVPLLISTLEDPYDTVREAAAAALGRIAPDDDASLSAVEQLTLAGSEGTRLAAVFALGQIGAVSTSFFVADRLDPTKEPSIKVRRRAAVALGLIKDPETIGDLVAAFGDDDWRVNYFAQDALAQFGAEAVGPLLAELASNDALIARYARKALVKMQPKPVEQLASALGSNDSFVRLGATLALADLGDPEADKLLAETAANDSDPQVQHAAQRRLQKSTALAGEAAAPAPAPSGDAAAGETAPAETSEEPVAAE